MTGRASVAGERTTALTTAARPLVVRLQRTLAIVLVVAVGAAVLIWYYLHLGTDSRAQAASQSASLRAAVASEMHLPLLARAPEPHPAPPPQSAEPAPGTDEQAQAVQGRTAPHAATPRTTAAEAHSGHASESATASASPVLVREGSRGLGSGSLAQVLRDARLASDAALLAAPGNGAGPAPDGPMSAPTASAEATVLGGRRWQLPKGTFLDCSLETAIDSTFAGMTACVLATDVYGADGRVVLMERGTRLMGETRSDVRGGQTRVAVMWSEARTPSGVALRIDSAGTDALGRAGVPGTTDRHFGERFGAAILLSVIDSTVNGLATRHDGAGVVYNAQGAHDVATEALRSTVAIPPTIQVAPGARVMVIVTRDVDFRSVYGLVHHDKP
ncbi:MAG: TrbI/VirB10 family protein [Proteobacteria bacterium]|nr:TrbI/VirB10 family protein [Pseudomonadota bacterium]